MATGSAPIVLGWSTTSRTVPWVLSLVSSSRIFGSDWGAVHHLVATALPVELRNRELSLFLDGVETSVYTIFIGDVSTSHLTSEVLAPANSILKAPVCELENPQNLRRQRAEMKSRPPLKNKTPDGRFQR